jgi:lysozyme
MKQILSFLVMILVLTGCQGRLSPTRLTVGADSTEMLQVPLLPDSLWPDTTSEDAALLQAELQYYFDRHNVQDEGYEMVAAYAQKSDTMLAMLPECAPMMNIGHWLGTSREGSGMERDTLGRIIIGTYVRDTLRNGLRLDSAGIYAGDMTGTMAQGHGYYLDNQGLYYEGQWQDDRQHGFGISAGPNTHVRVGEWKDGRYLGERINYTTERIYGIDISRYQHGKGRKKYPIYWNRLRINNLGSKSRKRVSGTIDYPVSFIFIKSTEGVSVRNPFYMQDYLAARKQGIPIGAYHFFSTKRGGTAQAQYFINSTLFRKGDLPPVLDVEPSAADIAKMGGVAVMWQNIRAWLRYVERYCGVKPILYISQTFVNKYLSQAPDVKRDYKVWIARYGEYKPDVKLVVWQLSPDGGVRGITGEVDINVFNGFKTQFDEFLEKETVK